MKYLSVLAVLVLVTYGQLIFKYEVAKIDAHPPGNFRAMMQFFFELVTNIGVWSGLLAAAAAAMAWLYALSKFELSAIYPLLSINFILVPLLAAYLFQEELTAYNLVGISLIVFGIIVFAQGA